MTPEELTPADREIAQLAMVRIHLARVARAEWTRQHQREPVTGIVRLKAA